MALQLRRGTNAERLSITPAQGELIFVTDYLAVNITGTTIASNLITFSSAHNLVVGQKLLYLGVTQNGLTQGTIYYVIALGLTTTACKLSTSLDGTAVTLTDGTELNLIFNKSPTNALGTPVGNVSPLWIGNGSTVGGISAQVSVLDDLLDVTLTSLEEGNTLYYDATAGQWKNNNILTIDDTTNSKNIIVTTNATNLFSSTNSNTDLAYSPIELRSLTSATPIQGFGSSVLYSANNAQNILKYLGSTSFNYSDLTAGSEDSEFRVKLLKAGESPVGYASYLDQFVVQSDGNILAAKDLTLNKDRTFSVPRILFNNTTKDGSLSWTGSGFFANGDFDVNKGANGTVNITTGSVGSVTTTTANLFCNNNIGTINIGNLVSTELKLGNVASGTLTTVNSPTLKLLGDIIVVGNDIKSGASGNPTAITLNNTDVSVIGDLTVSGNSIKSSSATAIELSSSDVTVVGDLTVQGNHIRSSTGVNTIELTDSDVTVKGDLTILGDNGGAYASIHTNKTSAEIFSNTVTQLLVGYNATDITVGATTGTTRIRNNAVVTGDLTVTGRNISTGITNSGIVIDVTNTNTNLASVPLTLNSQTTATPTVGFGSAALFTANNPANQVKALGVTAFTYTDVTSGSEDARFSVRLLKNGVTPLEPESTTDNQLTLNSLGDLQITGDLTILGDNGGVYASINTTKDKAEIFSDNVTELRIGINTTNVNISANTGTTRINNDVVIGGDLTVTGNDIKSSTATAITLAGTDVAVAGDLTVTGNDIKSSTATAITLAGADVTTAGNLTVGGNQIKHSNTTTQITLATGGVVFAGDIQVNGNDIKSSTGATAITLSGADVAIAGDLIVNGTTTTLNSTTLTVDDKNIELGSVASPTDITASGGGITLKGATDKTIIWNNSTDGFEINQAVKTTGRINVNDKIFLYANTGDIRTGGDAYIGGDFIKLNEAQTGTPSLDASFRVERGDQPSANLTWNEATDKWNTSHSLVVTGDLTTTGDVTVAGDLTVTGNDIKSSTATAITLSGANVTVAGDLTVTGNDIKSSTATAITLAGADVEIQGNLTVNNILAGGGDLTIENASTIILKNDFISFRSDANVTKAYFNTSGSGSKFTFNGTDADNTGNFNLYSHGTLGTLGNATVGGDLTVTGNDIKSSTATAITLAGADVTIAGDIKLGGNSIYDSVGNNALDFQSYSTIYGTSYQAKFNTAVNYGIGASFITLDNIVDINTSRLTTTSTAVAVLDFFDKTVFRSAKYLIQISNGTAHQMWEGMVIHNGTNIFVTAYGDIRTNGNLATVSVGFNATTGYAELRVTPVNATETKFKATKTYIVV